MCKGSGWVRQRAPLGHPDFGQVHPCGCLQQREQDQLQSRLHAYSNLGSLRSITFETLGPDGPFPDPESQALWRQALEAATEFAREPRGWLVLAGPSGCGKTALAAAIANACLEQGQPALFAVVPDLLDHLRASYSPDSLLSYDQTFDQVRNAPLLLLDDLGATSTTPWAQEKLYQVLNHRFNGRMPTVVTLRGAPDDLEPGLRTRLEAPGLSRVYSLASRGATRAPLPLLQVIGALGDRMRERMTFDNFDPAGSVDATSGDRETLRAAYDFARNYARSPQGWLLQTGGTGCGKKHLSVAIINERLKEGQRCCFALVPDLLDYLRAAFSPDSKVSYDERFDGIKSCPLLVLDNLGAEQSTPWAEEKLFQILEYRYNLALPTVINSNEKMEDLEATRPRIASRLKDVYMVQWIPITAPDYRDQGGKRAPSARRARPRAGTR